MKKLVCTILGAVALCLVFAPYAHASEADLLMMQLLQQANPTLYAPAAQPVVAPTPVPTPLPTPTPLPAVEVNPVTDPAAPALSTYVDVCIDTQTMVYYENGTPVLISPCVTGSPGRSTPKGVFMIDSCVPGKYLTGPTWHVWVNRWMRFSGNCGLHDASWRSSFGGDIYKRNGSHGCVNLPTDIAAALYDRVGIGTVVIVH